MQHKLQIELINDTINIYYISLRRSKETSYMLPSMKYISS